MNQQSQGQYKSDIPPAFEALEVSHGGFKVVWEWAGEGRTGDYDPKDPGDAPILRFSCYEFVPPDRMGRLAGVGGGWRQMGDAGSRTGMAIDSPLSDLAELALAILQVLKGRHYKRRLKELGSLCPDNLRRGKTSHRGS